MHKPERAGTEQQGAGTENQGRGNRAAHGHGKCSQRATMSVIFLKKLDHYFQKRQHAAPII